MVIGYRCACWGQYRALLDGPRGALVHGTGYLVQNALDAKRLQEYRTYRYKPRPCLIQMQNGNQVLGSTFVWDGDVEDLDEV
jgi:hypothetical protein